MPSDHRLVLLADTHVGDRTPHLKPSLLQAIAAEEPEAILHAGDVCKPRAIAQLNEIAPTHAVQGNRDWFMRYNLPSAIHTEINGVKITLTHGHINMKAWALNYLKLFLTWQLLDHQHYQQELARLYPDAHVIIYGHVHHQHDEVVMGKRFINPGVGYPEWRSKFRSQYAVMVVDVGGLVSVKLKSIA